MRDASPGDPSYCKEGVCVSKTKPAKMLALAEQVRLYIEVSAGYVGPGPAPTEPMGKKERGKSRPGLTKSYGILGGEPPRLKTHRMAAFLAMHS